MSVDLGDLTRDQMASLTLTVRAKERMENTRLRLEADTAVVQRGIYDSMESGVPAVLLAKELGLSVARIYQLREAISDQKT